MTKPPVPDRPFDPWTKIPVDQSRGSDFHRLMGIANHAAAMWVLGPDGPYKREQTMAQTVDGALAEGLLLLLELGVVDIDHDRMRNSKSLPMARRDLLDPS